MSVHQEPTAANRISVEPGRAPADWQKIFTRVDHGAGGFSPSALNAAAATATLVGVLGAAALLAMLVTGVNPQVSPYVLAMFVIPPGLLAGAAAGQTAGNLYLSLRFRLSGAARRGFAARLGLAGAPETWPASVKRWLFTGDWLGSPAFDARLPYLRIFVMGDAPATCRDEDALWREVHALIAGDSELEPGGNHREISYPRQLPEWARAVERGGYDELRSRIGDDTADRWLSHLWRRASRQWPGLGSATFPAGCRECFEVHALRLSDNREALAVILRPVHTETEATTEAVRHAA